jgi:hypothetical protein
MLALGSLNHQITEIKEITDLNRRTTKYQMMPLIWRTEATRHSCLQEELDDDYHYEEYVKQVEVKQSDYISAILFYSIQ